MKSNIKREDIYQRLVALAEKRNLRVDCDDVMRKLPPKERSDRFAHNLGGFYCAATDVRGPLIWLNPRFRNQPREWVLAHELAHHCLHRGTNALSPLYWNDEAFRNARETEASRFADKLIALMERKYRKENETCNS